MSDALTVELSSPTRQPQTLDADKVVVPSAGGVITIMPGHTEYMSQLDYGAVIVHQGDEATFFAVHGGFVEVLDNHILILADLIESATDIDVQRAKEARQRAEERMQSRSDDIDVERAELSMARSIARLQAHEGEHY